MKKFVHGLGMVLWVVGIAYCAMAVDSLFIVLKPPFEELSTNLKVAGIFAGFGALNAAIGLALRRRADAGQERKKTPVDAPMRDARGPEARLSEGRTVGSSEPAAMESAVDAVSAAHQSSEGDSAVPGSGAFAAPDAVKSGVSGFSEKGEAFPEGTAWTIIAPYLDMPLHDGRDFFLFRSEADARAFVEPLQRPELIVRELRGAALSRMLAECVCCGYERAIIKNDLGVPGVAEVDEKLDATAFSIRFHVPPISRFGHALPQGLAKVHRCLTQLDYTRRRHGDNVPDFWAKHLEDFKTEAVRYLAASSLCVPSKQDADGRRGFSIPAVRTASGHTFAAVFTDQLAIGHYMGPGFDSIVFPGLLSDLARQLREGRLGDAEAIMVNPGREEFRMTADEIEAQLEWLRDNPERAKAYAADEKRPRVIGQLHFAGIAHGDQVDLEAYEDGSLIANSWNDGYPNRMAGGGLRKAVPDAAIIPFDYDCFIEWLRSNFWNGTPVELNDPQPAEALHDFLRWCGKTP